MAPTRSSLCHITKTNASKNVMKASSSARRSRFVIAKNVPCTFLPHSFYLESSGMCCTNCTNYFGTILNRRKQNKSQHEMSRNFQCAQLASQSHYRPLKVVASHKLNAGRCNPSTTLPEIHHDDNILDNISTAEVLLSTGLLWTDNLNASSASTTNFFSGVGKRANQSSPHFTKSANSTDSFGKSK